MTNDGWGNAWPEMVPNATTIAALEEAEQGKGEVMAGWPKELWPEAKALVDIIPKIYDTKNLHKQGSNLVDDEGHLYFQCEGCEALFDPATKSFKTLHDSAHKQGWKVKWNTNGLGYKIYCVKCGD